MDQYATSACYVSGLIGRYSWYRYSILHLLLCSVQLWAFCHEMEWRNHEFLYIHCQELLISKLATKLATLSTIKYVSVLHESILINQYWHVMWLLVLSCSRLPFAWRAPCVLCWLSPLEADRPTFTTLVVTHGYVHDRLLTHCWALHCRVWFTTRVTATHSGPLKFFKKSFKATNKKVLGAPECLSYTFNEQGKCTSFTGGGWSPQAVVVK